LDAAPAFIAITKSLEQTTDGLRTKSPKNGKPRRCPLPGLAIEALRDHLAKQKEFRKSFEGDYRADLDLVFATPDGDYLKPDSVTAKVCLLTKNCNMAGASLHTMRHSHGSQLLSAGVPLPTVSKRLGHSSVNVTATVYAHAFAADELAAADAWEQRFQKFREQSVSKQATQ
jgi:integrase